MGKPFVKGDPRAGRPKGSKTRLTAQIVQDMFDSWNEPAFEGSDIRKGPAALNSLYHEQPREYAKLYATTFVPKEIEIERPYLGYTPEELLAMKTSMREQRAKLVEELPPLLIEGTTDGEGDHSERN